MIFQDEVKDIIENSKRENLKYLNNILRMKNITNFDAVLIMSQLKLSPNILDLINHAIERYEKNSKINKNISYEDFLYRLVNNIKKIESLIKTLYLKNENTDYLSILDLIVNESAMPETNDSKKPASDFYFSKVY